MKKDFLVFVPGSRSPPLGPWTLDELRRRLRDGEIPATAKVCAVGDEQWKSLDEAVAATPSNATAVDDDAVWFVHSTGLEKPVGPMSAAMVRLHLSAGEIPADAIAARKGDLDWIAVTNIAEAGPEIVQQEIDPEEEVATGYFRPGPEAVATLREMVQTRELELPPPRRTGAGPPAVTPRAPSLALLPVPVRPPPSAREPARESLATKLPSFSGSRLGSAVPAWVGKVRAQVVAHPVILPSIFGTALLVTLIAYASSARGFDERVRGLEATVSKLDSDLHAKDAELEKTRSLLEAAGADLRKTRSDVAEAQTEIKKLKQTPRYFFDQALDLMKASTDDAGDTKAIKAFQVVVDRFPEDAMATPARKRIEDLNDRIQDRAKKLRKAQEDVRRLIRNCKSDTIAAREAEDAGLVFNMFGEIEMNAVMAASRQGQAIRERATNAKEKAAKLLKEVPDPDGTLAKEVEGCDSGS